MDTGSPPFRSPLAVLGGIAVISSCVGLLGQLGDAPRFGLPLALVGLACGTFALSRALGRYSKNFWRRPGAR